MRSINKIAIIYNSKKSSAFVNTIAIGSGDVGAAYVDLPSVYDFSTLKKIAEDTKGKYFEVKTEEGIEKIFELANDKKELVFVPYDVSNITFFIAFVLLLFEWVLLNTRFRALP